MAGPLVECYSGHTYAQEPRALTWSGQRLRIVQVERRWMTPDGPAFWVRTEPGHRFEVRYQQQADCWTIGLLSDDHEQKWQHEEV